MRHRTHQRAISKKIAAMRREGYRGDVAAAAAHSMARRGTLGREGGYRRVQRKRRGPIGAQRHI